MMVRLLWILLLLMATPQSLRCLFHRINPSTIVVFFKILLENGASVYSRDNYDRTPLHHASSGGVPEIAKVFPYVLLSFHPFDQIFMLISDSHQRRGRYRS